MRRRRPLVRVITDCDICGEVYRGDRPAIGNFPPEGWHMLECSGGGCGQHAVCPLCEQQFAFTNVLGIRLVKCYRQLSDADWALISLRGMP